jgi:phosphohistidine phosphatase
MRELLLLRHAKSSWATAGLVDHERPLNARGRAAADLMGRWCADLGVLPDLIRSSDSNRTRETVERWCEAADWHGAVEWSRDLYHASPAALLDAARTAPDDVRRILIVAHNPGLEELASSLAGREIFMPTGTLAVFRAELDHWSDLDHAVFREAHIWRPRELAAQMSADLPDDGDGDD